MFRQLGMTWKILHCWKTHIGFVSLCYHCSDYIMLICDVCITINKWRIGTMSIKSYGWSWVQLLPPLRVTFTYTFTFMTECLNLQSYIPLVYRIWCAPVNICHIPGKFRGMYISRLCDFHALNFTDPCYPRFKFLDHCCLSRIQSSTTQCTQWWRVWIVLTLNKHHTDCSIVKRVRTYSSSNFCVRHCQYTIFFHKPRPH